MAVQVLRNKSIILTSGERKVLDELKKAYTKVKRDAYIYVQHSISSKRPDFLIIDKEKGISIIEVKDWELEYIYEVDRRKVKLSDKVVDNPIRQVKSYEKLIATALNIKGDLEYISDDISCSIIFVNIDKERAMNNELIKSLFNSDINYIFKSDINNLDISKIFNYDSLNYNNSTINFIRSALFPEIEIKIEKEKNINDEEIYKSVKALDFEQEEFAKRIPLGNFMVTGIPGSGKTVILLARAIYLIKENPDWKILILTYNKSLQLKLESKLNEKAKEFSNNLITKDIKLENITIKRFHQETYLLSGGAKCPSNIDKNTWFKEEVVNLAMKNVKPTYDAILIDEYQDFYMNWIELCVKLCKLHYSEEKHVEVKNIFLAGDRLQSIYNDKDISWKDVGIDIRGGGRSKFLKTSYRSANEHMKLALKFLSIDDGLKKEVDKFYKDDEDTELKSVNKGYVEFLEGDYLSITDMIINLKEQGYKNSDILILAKTRNNCDKIKENADYRIRNSIEFVKDIDPTKIEDKILTTTYQSSKGLESKIVFLTDIDMLYGASDTKQDKINKKLLYVGMTRASEKLYIHSEDKNGGFTKILKDIYEG